MSQENQITGMQKYKLQNERKTNYRNTEILFKEITKYKLKNHRNTKNRDTEIHIQGIQRKKKRYTKNKKLQKYKLQDYRNAGLNILELQVKFLLTGELLNYKLTFEFSVNNG